MNGWRALLSTSGLILALTATHGCSTGGEPAPSLDAEGREGEIEQLADGCGARQYRDTTHINCVRGGKLAGNLAAVRGSCNPGDEDHLLCTYPLLECDWQVAEVTTYCADGVAACKAIIPARPAQPPPQVIDLPEASQLCVPGRSTAQQRDEYCFFNGGNYEAEAKTHCEGQVEQHDTETSCCISCTIPAPGPGATSSSTCEGDGGPIGVDAGPIPADASVDHPAR